MAKAVLQQGCTAPVVPMQRFDPDQRQIPMGLGWPIVFRPLEDGGDFGLLLPLMLPAITASSTPSSP